MNEKYLPSIAVIDEATGLYKTSPDIRHYHSFTTDGIGAHSQELNSYTCEDRTKWHTHDISITNLRNEVQK